MIITTRIKIFLKRNIPKKVFQIIRFTADKTIIKMLPYFYNYKIKGFTERTIKEVIYSQKKFKIIIDPKNGSVDEQIFMKRLYEPHIIDEFVTNIQEGDVCIDVGANIGHHTIIMSQSAGEQGKVYAFEPIPFIRSQMEESILLNKIKNTSILPVGLSNKEEELTLYINKDNVGGSSLVNVNNGESISIQLKTLDSYSINHVDFIKIDVEGFEHHVLLGGEKTISRSHPKILFEYSPIYYRKAFPKHSMEILTFLKDHDYTLIDLENNKKIIVDIDSFMHEFDDGLRSQTNILAI